MSKLEQLINELCPDGVEYKKLADVCNFNRGTSLVSKNAKSGNIPVISGGQKPAFYHNEANRTGTTITVAGSGAYAGYVSIWYEPIFVCDAFSVEPKNADELDVKYLYHYLTNNQNKIYNKKTGAGIPHVHGKDIAKFSIPLPPLSIQSEIVHILDSFTLLTAELSAELSARKQQYEYYRDYLLSFDDEDIEKVLPDIDCSKVEYMKLGDIATDIYRGAGIKRDEVTETGTPCVRYGEIYTTYNVTFDTCVSHTDESKLSSKKYFEHGDVLFAITGESVEDIAKSCVYLGNEKCLAGGDIVVLKHNQNPKYMAYALSTTNAQMQKSKGKVKSKVVHSSVPAISDIVVPIPPLTEQEKIANMIERFDKLCNDISEGIPAEIEARKQQYEYYRDTLLSFNQEQCSQIVNVERERESKTQ